MHTALDDEDIQILRTYVRQPRPPLDALAAPLTTRTPLLSSHNRARDRMQVG